MRYHLRPLLVVMAATPPLLSIGWTTYKVWQAENEQLRLPRARSEWLDRFGVLPPPNELRVGQTP